VARSPLFWVIAGSILLALLVYHDLTTNAGEGKRWLGAEIERHSSGSLVVSNVANRSNTDSHTLNVGDIIASVNGEQINSKKDVEEAVAESRTVEIVVVRGNQALNITAKTQPQPMSLNPWIGGLSALYILILVYILMFKGFLNRELALFIGASLAITMGWFLEIFEAMDVLQSIRYYPLILLLSMNVISIILDESGGILKISEKIGLMKPGGRIRTFILFSLLTYFLSLWMNNLAAIFVIVPLTLSVCSRLGYNPVPLIVAEVIASNVGGASTMIGDFPNILISADQGINFYEFIIYMLPICFVELLLTIGFICFVTSISNRSHSHIDDELFPSPLPQPKVNVRKMRAGLFSMGLVIVLFVVLGFQGINPALPAAFCAVLCVLLSKTNITGLFKKIDFRVIFFFGFLFIIVGFVESSGVMDQVVMAIGPMTEGHSMQRPLLIMWAAAFATCFLNAGPTTALFIPIVAQLIPGGSGDNTLWWALSLGVCAGSSATLTGATAGVVAADAVSNYKGSQNYELNFKSFALYGVPLMFGFLIISSAYLYFLIGIN